MGARGKPRGINVKHGVRFGRPHASLFARRNFGAQVTHARNTGSEQAMPAEPPFPRTVGGVIPGLDSDTASPGSSTGRQQPSNVSQPQRYSEIQTRYLSGRSLRDHNGKRCFISPAMRPSVRSTNSWETGRNSWEAGRSNGNLVMNANCFGD